MYYACVLLFDVGPTSGREILLSYFINQNNFVGTHTQQSNTIAEKNYRNRNSCNKRYFASLMHVLNKFTLFIQRKINLAKEETVGGVIINCSVDVIMYIYGNYYCNLFFSAQ